MSKMNRGWLVVAAALAVGASGVAWADDGGDNSMNPMYGDSYANLQGNGHNVGTQGIAPEGAYAAHEMDGQTTTLMDQMHQTQAKMMEQARRTREAMAERTHAAAEKMRAALNPTSSAAASTTSSSTAVSATPTGTTSATPAPSSTVDTSQPTTDSGYKIAPVNPKGQAPTIVGPGG
jgi:hypothetical protein